MTYDENDPDYENGPNDDNNGQYDDYYHMVTISNIMIMAKM